MAVTGSATAGSPYTKQRRIRASTRTPGSRTRLKGAVWTGAELRRARLDLGLTQREMAARLELSEVYYSRHETGWFPVTQERVDVVNSLLKKAGKRPR